MCDHCGCRQVEPIGELMDEHDALAAEGDALRRALADGDRTRAAELWRRLLGHVDEHVHKEEIGLFTAMREQGEFVEEVETLEHEHTDLDQRFGSLDPISNSLKTWLVMQQPLLRMPGCIRLPLRPFVRGTTC